jgi:membrane protease YdiL (CAAX protease family)
MNDILPIIIVWMGVIAVTLILGLSPRFRRRPLVFVYPRREGLVSLGLTALLVVLAAAVVPAVTAVGETPLVSLLSPLAPPGEENLGSQFILSGLFVLPFALALLIRRQPLLSAGLGRQTLRPTLQLGAALAFITILLSNRTGAILDGVTGAEALYLAACVAVALAEEFIFRGYIQLRLSGWLGENQGWAAAAVLFTLWRGLLLVLASVSLPGLLWPLVINLGLALLLGWILRKTGNILAGALYYAVHLWVVSL